MGYVVSISFLGVGFAVYPCRAWGIAFSDIRYDMLNHEAFPGCLLWCRLCQISTLHVNAGLSGVCLRGTE